jgi:hypothetical protein
MKLWLKKVNPSRQSATGFATDISDRVLLLAVFVFICANFVPNPV